MFRSIRASSSSACDSGSETRQRGRTDVGPRLPRGGKVKRKQASRSQVLLAGGGGVGAATLGYGVGNWHFYNDDVERALEVFRAVDDGDAWAAFGFIAAEAELARFSSA